MDQMTEQQVVTLMQSSGSEAEWNTNAGKVRAAFGSSYPDFWYRAIVQSGVSVHTAAKWGGSGKIQATTISRRPLTGIYSIYSRPITMPVLKKGEQVIGVYDQGLGEKELVCTSLEDMQKLYDAYAQGMALTLTWVIASRSSAAL